MFNSRYNFFTVIWPVNSIIILNLIMIYFIILFCKFFYPRGKETIENQNTVIQELTDNNIILKDGISFLQQQVSDTLALVNSMKKFDMFSENENRFTFKRQPCFTFRT